MEWECVCKGREMGEMEGKELGRQEAKMKSFKKASKNQALLDMINSALHKSESIPSAISVTGAPRGPHRC